MTPRWRRWILAAVAVFLVLELADGFIALPLRAWSSTFAALLLRLAGFDIIQHGTILETGRFRFDVVPACSGSTSLRVLLALTLVWVGQSHLPGWRRIAAIVAAVAIALLCNGLRVAALVALGDLRLEPVEGIPHDAIGLCTFAIALGLVIATCDLLSASAPREDTQPPPRSGLTAALGLGLVLALLALPVATWSANAWITSPLDHWGWVAWILAGICWWTNRRAAVAPLNMLATWTLLSLGTLGTIAGNLIDLNLLGACAWLTFLAAVFSASGLGHLGAQVPTLALAALGLPTTGFLLTRISGWDGATASLILRACLALSAVTVAAWIHRRHHAHETTPLVFPAWLIAPPAITLALALGLTMYRPGVRSLDMAIPYLQGDWVGQDIDQGQAVVTLLGEGNSLHRRYQDVSSAAVVDLVVTRTAGDRHRAHPPEYCLTGAGWTITAESVISLPLGDGTSPEVRLLSLAQQGATCVFVAWFTDGASTRSTFHTMLAEDSLRRLGGQRSDWATIRIIALTEADLRRFASGFVPPRATPEATTP